MKGQTVDSFLSHLIQSVHFTSEMLVLWIEHRLWVTKNWVYVLSLSFLDGWPQVRMFISLIFRLLCCEIGRIILNFLVALGIKYDMPGGVHGS